MNEKEIRAIVRDEIEKASPKTEYPRLSQGGSQTVEPAPGSDAEHPPVGYRRLSFGEIRAPGYIIFFGGEWTTPVLDFTGAPHDGKLPVANPITANEGDSRLAESICFCTPSLKCLPCEDKEKLVAIPVGWKVVPEGIHREISVKIRRRIASGAGLGLLIYPDPSIPWGEGYEAILPSEAVDGDEFLIGSSWIRAISLLTWSERERNEQPWRRRIPATTPTEPARDLSDKIAESVVQDLQQACYDRDELRATVERLEAELDTTKRLLAESLVERDRLKNLHDARKVRIEGFRDVLRERLGDLV